MTGKAEAHQVTRLCGSGVDIRAQEALLKNGDEAALGLLADSGALVDESVDGGWGGGG